MYRRDIEPKEELKFLLTLLCGKQWNNLPVSIGPVWFESGQHQFCTDKPLRILLSQLENVISRVPQILPDLNPDTVDLLWELQAICIVAGEYQENSFFQLPLETNTAGEFLWKAIGRFCCLALGDNKFDTISETLNFDYFLEQYCSPATQEDLKLFPIR